MNKNNCLYILFMNCKNKKDLKERFELFLKNIIFDKNGNIVPDNTILDDKFEYDAFKSNIKYLVDSFREYLYDLNNK